MRRIAWLAALVPIGVAWACSSADSHPNALGGSPGQDSGYIVPGRDTGVSDMGVPDTHVCFGEVDGGCNALQLCGPELTIANTTNKAPAATGGTIVDGTYLLTSSTFYQLGAQGVNGNIREVIQITGSSAPDGGTEAAAESGSDEAGADDGSTESGSDGGTATPAGTVQEISQQPGASPGTFTWGLALLPPATMQWTQLCPSANAGAMAFQLLYTATPTMLVVYIQESNPFGLWEFTYAKQ